jgi:hypothetical protein
MSTRDFHIYIDVMHCFENNEINNIDLPPGGVEDKIGAAALAGSKKAGEQTTDNSKATQKQNAAPTNTAGTGAQQNQAQANQGHLKYEIVTTDGGTTLFLIDVDKKDPWPKGASLYATIVIVGGEWMMSINGGIPFDVTNREILTFKTVKKVQKTNDAKDGKGNVRQITEMPLSVHGTFYGKDNPENEKLKDGRMLTVTADPDNQTWLKWQNVPSAVKSA